MHKLLAVSLLAGLAHGAKYNCPAAAPSPHINECADLTREPSIHNGYPVCVENGCSLCGFHVQGFELCTKLQDDETVQTTIEVTGGEVVSMSDISASGDTNKRVTFFVDGALAWPDLMESIFTYVPDFAYGFDVVVPEWQFPRERRVIFSCPIPVPSRGLIWDGCTAFVYQYRCPGCTFNNGGLPKFMLDNGWEASYCAPRFRLVNGGQEHPMVTFHKSMAPGESVHFDTSDTTEFIAWHGSRVPVHCATRMTSESCLDTPNHPGICVWDHNHGVCRSNFCKRNYGPGARNPGQCTHCTSDDINASGEGISMVMVQSETGRR